VAKQQIMFTSSVETSGRQQIEHDTVLIFFLTSSLCTAL
jgi:hypothetical protein